MKRSLGRNAHGLAACATTVAGVFALGSLDPTSYPLLAAGIGAVTSIGANAVSDALRERFRKRTQQPRDVLGNHDLCMLVGDSIRVSLLDFLERDDAPASPATCRAIEKTARGARENWKRLSSWPGLQHLDVEEVQAITEPFLPDLLTQHATLRGGAKALTPEAWEEILAYLAKRAGAAADLPEAVRTSAARHLHDRFAQTLWELLKKDAENNGKGFAAIQLMVFGELLDAARASARGTEELQGALPNLEQGLRKLLSEKLDAMDGEERRRHRALLGRLIEIDRSLDALREALEQLGHPRALLHLDPREAPGSMERKSLAARLVAENRAIGMWGREREFDALTDWLMEDAPVSIRLVTGEAGIGKTRLAIELCDAARGVDWESGFCSNKSLRDFLDADTRTWAWDRPTLAVFDYASGRTELLKRFLRALAECPADPGERPPLRLLLLDRHGGEGLPWWQELLPKGASRFAITLEDWYDSTGDIELEPLHGREDRRGLLRAAAAAFGNGEEIDTDTLLAHIDRLRLGSTPLLLQIAVCFHTLLASEHVRSRENLLDAYLEREGNEILSPLGLSETQLPLFRRCVAYLSLVQGDALPIPDLEDLLRQEADACGYDRPAPAPIRNRLIEYLGTGPSSEDGEASIRPLLPDLIAEYWILRELGRDPSPQDRPFLARAIEHRPAATAEVLVRAAQDFPGLRKHWGFLVPWIQGDDVPESFLHAASQALPESTVALRDLAAATERSLLVRARGNPETAGESLAERLLRFSFRVSDVDDREEALSAIEEAVGIYRSLAGARPDAFEPDLAMSLNNLSGCHAALGRREEALSAIEEAVRIRRRLAEARPDAFEPDLAASLNNLSGRHAELGRREEALSAIEEAVGMLAPYCVRYGGAFRDWARAMCGTYLRCCEALGRVPDEVLLAGLAPSLGED